MKPKKPLPTERPFVSFYTNTYRRPAALARNFASISKQTLVAEVEQIVIPDHLGHYSTDAVYGRLPWYADAVRGEYVNSLGDDDCLAADDVVARLKKFVRCYGEPDVVVVNVKKGDDTYPKCGLGGVPVEGDVDFGSYILRRDVWVQHAREYGGGAYKCDYDGLLALQRAGRTFAICDLLFAVGAVGGSRPEVDWT